MGEIYLNTDVAAPGCPAEVVEVGTGRSILIQSDWEYPSFARTFGWSTELVQRCAHCAHVNPAQAGDGPDWYCEVCGHRNRRCEHIHTDGTLDCTRCGVNTSDFLRSAGSYLEDNDGRQVEDPGYFAEAE